MPTSYALTGFRLFGTVDSPLGTVSTTLVIQGSDTLGLTFTPDATATDPADISGTLSVTEGEIFGLVLDGQISDLSISQWSAEMGEVTNGSETTQILKLVDNSSFDQAYVFVLSGSPVGVGAVPTDIEVATFFDGTITDISSGPFAANTAFSPADILNAEVDPDPFSGTAGPDSILGFSSNDLIDGQAGADSIVGGFGNDTILGGAGPDFIIGGGGNDDINSGADVDNVHGGGGLDIIRGTPSELNGDTINGLDFGDLIIVEGVSAAAITAVEGAGANEVLIDTTGDGTPEASFSYIKEFGDAQAAGLVVTQDGGNVILQLDPGLAPNAGIGTGILGPQDFLDIGTFLFADNSISPIDIDYVGAVESLALLADGYSINEISGASPIEVVGIDRGVFLSSGAGPGTSNTESGFSLDLREPGDPRLTQSAKAAFPEAGITYDASLITFTFDASDLGDQPSISFDLFFGSDEFPEFVNSLFVDIAVVYVNGVNYALFNNDPGQPLSIVSESINTPGNFYNNNGDNGTDTGPFTGTFDTEYDGFSVLLSVIAPVQPGINTVTFGVADTGDQIYDSGLFIGNLQGSNFDTSGSFVQTTGTTGNDSIEANSAPQLITMVGGQDTVSGTAQELNGDLIDGFGNDDMLIIEEAIFTDEDVTVTLGSAILDIDSDGDGTAETRVTLEGDFSNAVFSFSSSNGNTLITGQNIGGGLDLIGDETNETLIGSAENDTIQGLGGNDTIDGLAGNDSLLGGSENDYILGGFGSDTLEGGDGDDTLDGGAGGDTFIGGAGRDTVTYESATRSVRVDLENPAFMFNDAVGDSFTSIEVFQTGNTVDQLRGDSGSNEFYAGGLSDRLYGRAGDDLLFGEAGADAFYGNLGADTMTGGDDAGRRDRFIYFSMAESSVGAGNRDVITDFVSGEDRIEISRFDADLTQGFKQSFDFIGDAAFSNLAGQLRYEQTGGITVVQADVTGDGLADFEIELTGTIDLQLGDFLI